MSRNSISQLVALLGLGYCLVACGGAMAGDDGGSGGYSPDNSSNYSSGSSHLGSISSTSNVGSASSTSKPNQTICFGEEKPKPSVPVLTLEFDPVTSEECIAAVEMRDTLRLNPAFTYIYFKGSDGARSEVPYLGVGVGACANATAYGGWYATNISGGSTHIGLCSCSCNTARLHGFFLDINQSGIPK